MFLQYIRSDAALVVEVFGEERETTAQSILAAQKWRSMTDEERKVSCASTLSALFRSSVFYFILFLRIFRAFRLPLLRFRINPYLLHLTFVRLLTRSLCIFITQPFLAQAEKEKLEYEAARRMYEDGSVGFESTISFNVPQTSGQEGATFVISTPAAEHTSDCEPDSEGFVTDEERHDREHPFRA